MSLGSVVMNRSASGSRFRSGVHTAGLGIETTVGCGSEGGGWRCGGKPISVWGR
jgi:hypothetical protein